MHLGTYFVSHNTDWICGQPGKLTNDSKWDKAFKSRRLVVDRLSALSGIRTAGFLFMVVYGATEPLTSTGFRELSY